ncbi:hypothetical protein BDF22DRAFT_698862 [Syncephalis plumigaleata]|nr:hypothetical protein BDF22DRAFT_698862 [Syncephalis plumigaleata]
MSTPTDNEQYDSALLADKADSPQKADNKPEAKDTITPTEQDSADKQIDNDQKSTDDNKQTGVTATSTAPPKADFTGALARAKAAAALMTTHSSTDDSARGADAAQGTKRAYDDVENGGNKTGNKKRDINHKEREAKRGTFDKRHDNTSKKTTPNTKHHKNQEHFQKNTGGQHHKNSNISKSNPSNHPSNSNNIGNISNIPLQTIQTVQSAIINATTTTKEFQVPHSMAGLVIGRGGENLKRIEQQTMTRVQFTQDPPDAQGMRRVTAIGSAEGVDRAYQLVQALLEDPQTGQTTGNALVLTGQTSETVLVPNERVGLLIGRGGETIREIQRRANVRVNVTPDAQASGGQSERPVQVIGDVSGVQMARALIHEIIDGTSSLITGNTVVPTIPAVQPMPSVVVQGPGGTVTETIEVTHDSIGGIIGRGGETVKYLQQLSGARIQVEPNPNGNNPMRKVHISGTQDAVSRARSMIDEQVSARNRGVPGRYDPRAQDTNAYNRNYFNAYAQAYAYGQQGQIDYSAYYAQYGQQYADYYAQYYSQQAQQMQQAQQPGTDNQAPNASQNQ